MHSNSGCTPRWNNMSTPSITRQPSCFHADPPFKTMRCGMCVCVCECCTHVPNSSPARRAACRAAGKPPATISSNKMKMYEHMRREALLTCGCCSKYPHHRHSPHVALPEFRVAHVQLLDGTCQIVVRGDDPHGEHDCRRRLR